MRLRWFAVVPLLAAGCLSPFTRRLDEANQRAAAIHQQMILATEKMDEAAKSLERSEKKLDEASQTLKRMEQKLEDLDKRSATIEQGFKKMFGLKGPEEEEWAPAGLLTSPPGPLP